MSGPTIPFVPALHGFRAIAAMEVLLFHWVLVFPAFNAWLAAFHVPGYPWINPTLPWAIGWQGVPLFFVLSGYLLTSQWQGRPLKSELIGRYYLRRALRIYPAVWLQFVLLVVLGLALPHVYAALPWQSLLLNALLWVNLPPFFAPLLNAVWWTLPVELLFYLCLPALVGLKRRAGFLAVAILAFAITFGWRWAVMARYAGQDLSGHVAVLDALPGVLSVFWAGCAAAWIQHRLQPQHGKRLFGWSMLAFLAVQALLVSRIDTYWQGGWLLGSWSSLLAVSLAGLILAVCRGTEGRVWRALSARPMVWLGELSFGIYLWHLPVMLGLRELMPQAAHSVAGSLLALGAALVLTLMLAALSFYGVERPAMNWGRR
jgi:peptidoglycan/LPS O-acetylase OafA/YrhL